MAHLPIRLAEGRARIRGLLIWGQVRGLGRDVFSVDSSDLDSHEAKVCSEIDSVLLIPTVNTTVVSIFFSIIPYNPRVL